jgi:uncharacterized MAPEG superfamily protein
MTIALWCLLAAGIIPQLFGMYAKASKNFDNNNPREFLAQVQGKKARAVAAMQNGYEGLPLFIAAVLIAHIVPLLNPSHIANQSMINMLAIGYIVTRIAFGFLYIAGLGTLRSLVWLAGMACIIGLFVISA